MELHWRINIQHVGSCRNNQDVRSYSKGDDGIVNILYIIYTSFEVNDER